MIDWEAYKSAYKPFGVLFPIGDNKIPISMWQKTKEYGAKTFNKNCGLRPLEGYIVLDVDCKEGKNGFASYNEILQLEDVRTLTAISPSGGKHFWFRIPLGVEITNKVEIVHGIDTRCAGKGHVKCYPMKGYEWEDWEPEQDNTPYIAELPKHALNILIEKSKSKLESSNVKPDGDVGKGGRNAYLTSRGGRLRAAGLDYDEIKWALSSINLKECKPPLSDEEVDAISKSVSRYAAPDLQKERELLKHGSRVAENFIRSHQEKIALQLIAGEKIEEVEKPENIIPLRGLMKDMVELILEQSIRPQPCLALAASIATIGALAGQRYRTETDLRTNVYFVGLAQAGHGKDQARKTIKKLTNNAGLDDYIGGEDFASGQAVISAMAEHPSKLFLIDELGKKLNQMTGHNSSSHQKEIISTLLVLYSSASSVYKGKEYADKRVNPTKEIANPNACLYGTSTESTFYGALQSGDVLSGAIPRLIVVATDRKRPARQRPKLDQDTYLIERRLKAIAEHMKPSSSLMGYSIDSSKAVKPMTVKMTDEVFNKWEKLDDSFDELMTDDMTSGIYSRVAENTAKLALIYAVSIDHIKPIIDDEAYEWAKDLCLWCANSVIKQSNDMLSDNLHEKNLKRVMRTIKNAGTKGISKKDLAIKTQFLKSRDRDEILMQLIECEEISMETIKTVTKPRIIFKYNPKNVLTK